MSRQVPVNTERGAPMRASLRGKRHDLPDYTPAEERTHILTHGLGALLSLAGFVLLVGAKLDQRGCLAPSVLSG